MFSWFKRKPKPLLRDGYRTFTTGGGWSDAIEFQNWEQRRVVGWKRNKPQEGDLLKATMESGKVALFAFTDVKYCGDPQDMFFADVVDLNHEMEEV